MSVYKAYRYDVFAFPQGYYRNEIILFRALHYWEFRFLWEQFFSRAPIFKEVELLKSSTNSSLIWIERGQKLKKSPTEIIAIGHFKGLFFPFSKYWESKMLYR